MTIIRSNIIGPSGEMQMRLIRKHGVFVIHAKHDARPGLIGFRRLLCDDEEQAVRVYEKGVASSSAELERVE